MVLYLLKSSFCLAILLAVYYLFLEKEKMHQFNRFYLLGSILFSFLAPSFIIYTNPSATVEPFSVVQQITGSGSTDNSFNYSNLLYILYGLIATILLIRFSINVFDLVSKIKSNTKTNYKNATLVLLVEKLIPYTFLNYIFINKSEFQTNKLEKELFEHELTHVREKHTIDIFIVELLQIICWFNPLIIYLKRAIKLNHEFIADNNVIQSYNNTTEYQYLLLSKVSQNQHSYLASNFNYLLTKKRLQMMTKQSSQLKMLLKKIAIIPMAIALLFVFANRVTAKEIETNSVEETYILSQEKVTPEMISEYNGLAKKYNSNPEFVFKKKEIQRLKYIYSLMSAKQKETAESFPDIPPPPPPAAKKVVKGELVPPPPIPANATAAQKEKYKKAVKKYKKEAHKMPPPPAKAAKAQKESKAIKKSKNPKPVVIEVVNGKLVPPPPIPANATKEQKVKYKKAMEKYNKAVKNLPPPPPPKNKVR